MNLLIGKTWIGLYNMKNDLFGDRMKEYEKTYTSARISQPDILCVRIDGKRFSKFTKGFIKPFDINLNRVMVDTTMQIATETNAKFAYTQSDEITLIYSMDNPEAEYIFGGKVSKLNSILASMTTAYFNAEILKVAPTQMAGNGYAFFDCRSFAVPSLIEASNVILWRVQDAKKNSISSLFRWTAGHKKMQNLSGKDMIRVLEKDFAVVWDNLPNAQKYGTYIKPVSHNICITPKKLHKNKDMNETQTVKRKKYEEIDLGYFGGYSLEERVELLTSYM